MRYAVEQRNCLIGRHFVALAKITGSEISLI